MANKIYTEKTRKLRQNTQKIANFLRNYGKIHSNLPIFRVKSVKFTPAKKNLHAYIRGIRDKYEVCIQECVYNRLVTAVSMATANYVRFQFENSVSTLTYSLQYCLSKLRLIFL